MGQTSFNRLLTGDAPDRNAAEHAELVGKVSRSKSEAAPRVSRGFDARLASARRFGFRGSRKVEPKSYDPRQRAIVKIHFFGHGGGGGAALKAHGRYLQR